MEKLEWCGYRMVKKLRRCVYLCDMIHECDRRTDRQTDGHRVPAYIALCIASRGKNAFIVHLLIGDALPPVDPTRMRLYSMRFCPFVQRTQLVLEHKKIH